MGLEFGGLTLDIGTTEPGCCAELLGNVTGALPAVRDTIRTSIKFFAR